MSAAVLAAAPLALAHSPEKLEGQAGACAQYLGNEAVVISAGETKILFDAFYTNSYGQYALVPDQLQQALLAGTPPFDGVDAVFVSHIHGDHFTVEPTLDYLRAHPDVVLYASKQVVDVIVQTSADKSIADRLVAFDLQAGDPAQTAELKGISIDVVRIPHAGGAGRANIENLAFRVSLDEAITVMHMGDADPDDRHFAPHQDHWDSKTLDVAMPPYWFFGSPAGRSIIEGRLKPTHAIGVHVPIAAADDAAGWKARANADLFTTPGEMREFGESRCTTKTED
ncbi:MAG: MBL fold metallo-hydrolase [Pseudomonadota bacterium]